MSKNKQTLLAWLALAVLAIVSSPVAAQKSPQSKISFQRQVLPVLKSSCMRCHQSKRKDSRGRTRKPKGGLRLDGKGWMLAGGKHGAAVVPGKPKASLLLTRIALDPEDDDFMPAKGDALTKAQIDLVDTWIQQGADFGSWTGATGPGSAIVAKAQKAADVVKLATPMLGVYQELGKGLKPAFPAAIRRASGQKCQVVPIQPKSPLLRVAFVSNESSVGDLDLRQLEQLASHITYLGLAKTRITDAALESVGRMRRLTRLDLNRTKVSDAGLEKLVHLDELRSINLHSTSVTDEGVLALAQLPRLERIYLWNSKVTAAGVAKLRSMMPKAKISFELSLPKPIPAQGNNNRRRRKKK